MQQDNKKINRISLRIFIAVAIIITAVGLLWIFSVVSEHIYSDRYEKQLIADADRDTELLKDIEVIGADEGSSDYRIDMLSSLYAGRVMIVDSDYRIIKDSADRNQGEYIVSEKLITAMTGTEDYYTYEQEDYIQFIKRIDYKDSADTEASPGRLVVMHISKESISTMLEDAHDTIRLAILIIVLIIIAVAILISAVSVRDIRYINDQIDILQNGHLDQPIEEKGFKEYRNLIENYNDTIKKLSEIDTSRQEFVSNVSHELKTPITSMKVLADSLVQNEAADLDMYKEFMSDIVDEIDRESKIINDLLTLVRMDKQSAEMNMSSISINELLEVIIKRVTPIAETRNIDLSYESFKDVVADVDEVKLSLALSNIIENAVKYNIDNGWVKVSLNADHKYFYVKVADSGVGIPDDCKDRVFDRFFRVDKARSRDTGGTGLGLAITKNVIGLHGGTIKLYSESGVGTTFTIRIPLKQG